MAPEIINNQSYNREVDVWSLGILLFELLHGYSPFYAENVMGVAENVKKGKISFKEGISSHVKDLISSILHLVPKKRITIEEIKQHPALDIIKKKSSSKEKSKEKPVSMKPQLQNKESKSYRHEKSMVDYSQFNIQKPKALDIKQSYLFNSKPNVDNYHTIKKTHADISNSARDNFVPYTPKGKDMNVFFPSSNDVDGSSGRGKKKISLELNTNNSSYYISSKFNNPSTDKKEISTSNSRSFQNLKRDSNYSKYSQERNLESSETSTIKLERSRMYRYPGEVQGRVLAREYSPAGDVSRTPVSSHPLFPQLDLVGKDFAIHQKIDSNSYRLKEKIPPLKLRSGRDHYNHFKRIPFNDLTNDRHSRSFSCIQPYLPDIDRSRAEDGNGVSYLDLKKARGESPSGYYLSYKISTPRTPLISHQRSQSTIRSRPNQFPFAMIKKDISMIKKSSFVY